MSWWGKLAVGTFGFLIGGPVGAMLGIALGHNLDRATRVPGAEGRGRREEHARVQTAFFTATFLVMGHLAKADGRVSENEISSARATMAQMGLSPAQEQTAMHLFREGKQADFALDAVLDRLRSECRGRSYLIRLFVEIQFGAAYADGALDYRERAVLTRICDRLGFSRFQFERLDAYVRAQRQFRNAGTGDQRGAHAGVRGRPRPSLADAYAVLELPSDAKDDEVKKAYRRLISQNHPDKLVARGLPEEMMRLATDKTREIKTAYERIKEARGL